MTTETVVDPQTNLPIEVDENVGSPGYDAFSPNQANASQAASQNGAAQEPSQEVGSQSQAPQPQNQEPEDQSRVEVVQQPQTPAPQQAPQQEPVAKQEDTAGLEALAKWQAEQNQSTEEVLRRTQSTYDRRASQLERQIQEAAQAQQNLVNQIRELQTQGLSEEERAEVMAKFAQEDRTNQLQEWEGELVTYHRDLLTWNLTGEFGQYGVTEDSLAQFETPEEMEAFCYEAKATYLENQLATGQVPAQPQAAAPAPPAPPQQETAPQANFPAGANAPTDLGGGGQSPQQKEFSKEASQDAFLKNFKDMGWETVRIR